jgi:hypothetical protein
MDYTVYQCPECNFNADSMDELDMHLNDLHYGNDNRGLATRGYAEEHENVECNEEEANYEKNMAYVAQKPQHMYDDDYEEDFFFEKTYETNEDVLDEEENFFDDKNDENFEMETSPTKPANVVISNSPTKTENKVNIQSKNNRNGNTLNLVNSNLNTSTVVNSDNHYERQYACKRCDFFTNNPRALLYHRKDAHQEKINVHECSFCQYASQYSGKVERHTLLRHKIDINSRKTTYFKAISYFFCNLIFAI